MIIGLIEWVSNFLTSLKIARYWAFLCHYHGSMGQRLRYSRPMWPIQKWWPIWPMTHDPLTHFHLCPREAMLSAVFATATRLSVCVSQPVYIVSNRRELASWFLHHLIAPWLHSLAKYQVWLVEKFSRGNPERGLFMRLMWWVQTAILAIFRPISHRISETVQDTTIVTIEH